MRFSVNRRWYLLSSALAFAGSLCGSAVALLLAGDLLPGYWGPSQIMVALAAVFCRQWTFTWVHVTISNAIYYSYIDTIYIA